MDKTQIGKLKGLFDNISHTTDDNLEFWYARELQELLGYARWENFANTIDKAKTSCKNSGYIVDECFRDVTKTLDMPKGGIKEISDIMMTRYACYLTAHNGDPRKAEIAFAQAYFALQTLWFVKNAAMC